MASPFDALDDQTKMRVLQTVASQFSSPKMMNMNRAREALQSNPDYAARMMANAGVGQQSAPQPMSDNGDFMSSTINNAITASLRDSSGQGGMPAQNAPEPKQAARSAGGKTPMPQARPAVGTDSRSASLYKGYDNVQQNADLYKAYDKKAGSPPSQVAQGTPNNGDSNPAIPAALGLGATGLVGYFLSQLARSKQLPPEVANLGRPQLEGPPKMLALPDYSDRGPPRAMSGQVMEGGNARAGQRALSAPQEATPSGKGQPSEVPDTSNEITEPKKSTAMQTMERSLSDNDQMIRQGDEGPVSSPREPKEPIVSKSRPQEGQWQEGANGKEGRWVEPKTPKAARMPRPRVGGKF